MPDEEAVQAVPDSPWEVVVKVRDGWKLDAESPRLQDLLPAELTQSFRSRADLAAKWRAQWAALLETRLKPRLTKEDLERLEPVIERAQRLERDLYEREYRPPDFSRHYLLGSASFIDEASQTARSAFARARLLRFLPQVAATGMDLLYTVGPVASFSSPPVATGGSSPLRRAPFGVDADHARSHFNQKGGHGDAPDLVLVNVEMDWPPTEVNNTSVRHLGGHPPNSRTEHGRQVLESLRGINGVAPGLAQVGLVSPHSNTNSNPNLVQALAIALANRLPGHLLLIEVQQAAQIKVGDVFGKIWAPVELDPLVFDLIECATKAGIIVIEPLANGELNLDGVSFSSPWRPDSGAILVAAGRFDSEQSRWERDTQSNQSPQRAHCFADGSQPPNDTSAASAIIAGTAAVVQAVARSVRGSFLTPAAMRNLLAAGGTAGTSGIKTMPNLAQILGTASQGDPISSAEVLP